MTITHALVAVYAAYSSLLCSACSHPAELLHGRLTACLMMSCICTCMGRSQLSGMAHCTQPACTCILQHAATSRDCSCLRYTSSIVQRSLLQVWLAPQSAEQLLSCQSHGCMLFMLQVHGSLSLLCQPKFRHHSKTIERCYSHRVGNFVLYRHGMHTCRPCRLSIF